VNSGGRPGSVVTQSVVILSAWHVRKELWCHQYHTLTSPF